MNKHLLLLLVGLFFGINSSFAQEDDSPASQAKFFMETAEEILRSSKVLTQAREMYEAAALADPSNVKANFLTGEYYLLTVNKELAVNYFLKVKELNEKYRFDIYYKIGQAYQYGYNFDNALEYYQMYKAKLVKEKNYRGQDKVSLTEVDRRIAECTNGAKYKANPANYSIVNAGRVNSESWDYAPVLNSDETVMIFTSRRRDDNINENVDEDNFHFEDIFISRKGADGKWGYAKNIGEEINTRFHDSNLGLSPDGKQLFIYKDVNNGDIFVSDLLPGDKWSVPRPLSNAINSEGYAEKSVSVDKDNKVMFYSSNRPGGFGGLDIYVSTKDSRGEWSRSVNLGPMINTEFDDDAPFIAYDGKTLYFSSKGRDGMGGHDIYKTEYDSAQAVWSPPINLGYPINTPDDDIYFVATKDGKRGYYASVREDGQGYTDIYMVTIPDLTKDLTEKLTANQNTIDKEVKDQVKPDTEVKAVETSKNNAKVQPVLITVRVEEFGSEKLLDAKMGMISSKDRVTIPAKKLGNGLYEFAVMFDEEAEFMLSAERDGYIFQNLKLLVPAAGLENKTISRRLELKRLEVGSGSVLRNIYFEFDKAVFTTESYNELNKLERMLLENPTLKIEISGHTDNIGGAAYNKILSQKRANAVTDYLKRKGIDARRLSAVGYGQERPLASNDDEKWGRELNRRVEFKVIEN